MSRHADDTSQKDTMDTLEYLQAPTFPQTLEDLYTQHADTAKKIARREHRKMPSCTVEDMEQAIWEHATKQVKYYLGKDAGTIESYMTRAAKQFWSKERIDWMYFNGAYIYTPADVRKILANSAWSRIDECPDVDGRVDVRTAFLTLAPKQAQAVFKLYGLKEDRSTFTKSEMRNLFYGVDNITHRLNSKEGLRPSGFDELIEVGA